MEDERTWLALYRAVEPLCFETDSCGIERTWKEMRSDKRGDELRTFLKAALRREEIILERDRPIDRIRRPEVVDRAAEYMGLFFGPDDEELQAPEPPVEFWNGMLDEDGKEEGRGKGKGD